MHLKSPIPKRPRKTSYLLCDATTSLKNACNLFDGPINDVTPSGKLKPIHRIVQHADCDIAGCTTGKRLTQILLSLFFLKYPTANRVGIICHLKQKSTIVAFKNSLPENQQERIVMIEHFRGTVSRGSNRFQEADLDALFIMGTPRVPMSAVRDRVLQFNRLERFKN